MLSVKSEATTFDNYKDNLIYIDNEFKLISDIPKKKLRSIVESRGWRFVKYDDYYVAFLATYPSLDRKLINNYNIHPLVKKYFPHIHTVLSYLLSKLLESKFISDNAEEICKNIIQKTRNNNGNFFEVFMQITQSSILLHIIQDILLAEERQESKRILLNYISFGPLSVIEGYLYFI